LIDRARLVIGPRVIGLQTGRSREYVFGTRIVRSAIGKMSVDGPIAIGVLGLEGDEQVDHRYHGGPERALCVYPGEHLEAWGLLWNRPLPPGSFGENLTTLGLSETTVHIGDRFRFGSALIEVSQPREPCGNLAGRQGKPDLPQWIRKNRWTGWYARVVEPGEASPGLAIIREHADSRQITVAEAYWIRLDTKGLRDHVKRLLEVPGLSSGWRVSLQKRL